MGTSLASHSSMKWAPFWASGAESVPQLATKPVSWPSRKEKPVIRLPPNL